MSKLNQLKRVTKRLAIAAKNIGASNLVDLVDDDPRVNIGILEDLTIDCEDNILDPRFVKLRVFITKALNGYRSGNISKILLNKPFYLED